MNLIKWVDQVAQGGCGITILGDVQNPTGHRPVQPALADLSLNSVGVLDGLQRCFPI